MPPKYAAELYTTKGITLGSQRTGWARVVADPNSPLEQQVQDLVFAGNIAYVKGKYAEALECYMDAWALLPVLVDASLFPLGIKLVADALLKADLTDNLISVAPEIHKFRDPRDPLIAIIGPLDPPGELLELTGRFGVDQKSARGQLQLGRIAAESGQIDIAKRHLARASKLGDGDLELQADANAMFATIDLRAGDHSAALERTQAAMRHYEKLERPEAVAAMKQNMGVALTVAGRADEAGALFAEAEARAPGGLGWRVTHTVNPGVESIIRQAGAEGLPMLVKSSSGDGWDTIAGGAVKQQRHTVEVIRSEGLVRLDLATDPAAKITKLYEERIDAVHIKDLEAHLTVAVNFVTYLAHVQGFLLPLAIGDTCVALGDYPRATSYYRKARDYRYLNRAIERPMLWAKHARAYLQLANRMYRDRDMAGAKAHYQKILKVGPNGFELSGELYEGGYAGLKSETLDFLQAPNPLGFNGLDWTRRLILLEAKANLNQILNGINYLGFPEEIVPLHSWRYLQNAARYLANQAIQSERAYINFKETAEREEFTRLALEQGVDAQAAAVDVEKARLAAAKAQQEAANESAEFARTRRDNAIDQRDEYKTVSKKLAALDEIIAFANASANDTTIEISSSWASSLGIESGEYDAAILTQLLTRKRSQLTREYELANMDRQIEEQNAAVAVADAQVEVADKMVVVGEEQLELAELRAQQAQAQLEHFDSEEFTPELWDNLAQAQRQISRRYLDWAIGAAFLMERAFEFEYDVDVNRIRFDYEQSNLHGLLAADFLLADIDQFSYDRLLETRKRIPVKLSIALADRYPSQFREQFQRTGRIDFQVLLDDFERRYPGAHMAKVRRVEVVVEGLVGPDGLHGTLTNAGSGVVRDRHGVRKTRVHPAETMLLSRFDLRHDGFVFSSDEDVLDLFEHSGLATGWILDLPPDANDVDYSAISNIHLVVYAEAFYSPIVANRARAELAATAGDEHSLGLGLRFQFPDEFFAFQDTSEIAFTLDNAYLPFNHSEPVVRELHVRLEGEGGVPLAGVELGVTAPGVAAVQQETTADGMASTGDASEALNALRGADLTGDWVIGADPAANPGFDPATVENIYLFAEYGYTPRGRATATDDFATDTLAEFDVVDDAGAGNGGPSAWAHDAARGAIVQTSNIHGPSNATTTDPDKPGTYLVRKESPDWRPLADVVVRARVRSDDDDGIGLVFRYQDEDNFYFLLIDSQRGYRRLGKKVGGVFADLHTAGGLDSQNGYPVGQELELSVTAVGDALAASLDGQLILSARDGSIADPGRVGLYAWGNPAASFLELSVRQA
jgi:hypothetical protein